jgi:hypothetical protein
LFVVVSVTDRQPSLIDHPQYTIPAIVALR